MLGQNNFRFQLDKSWAKVPSHIQINNCHELAVTKDNRVIMTTDHPANNVVVFDHTGHYLNSWTLGYDGCHGLTLFEEEGQERLLITHTDVQEVDGIVTKGCGEVVKTTLDGEVLHRFSTPIELGIYSQEQTFNPTETAVAPNGDVYIADGYGASYILCFDKNGRFRFKFGGFNDLTRPDSLHCPHGITLDQRHEAPILLVSSRKQSCFKAFNLNGEFQYCIELPGAYPCRPVISGQHLLAGVCWSGPTPNEDKLRNYEQRMDESGFVLVLNNQNQVVSVVGGQSALYENDNLQPLAQIENNPFHHIHDVLPINGGDLIITQWRAEQSLPYTLKKL